MAEVLEVLANEDENSSKYSAGTGGTRVKKAIAAGLLLGGPSKGSEIADAKLAALARRNLNLIKGRISRRGPK
jgi:hypothetical protein